MTAEARARSFWDVPDAPEDGAWRAKRRLASALRELVALCVTSEAPENALAYAADAVARVAERLGSHPKQTFQEAHAGCATQLDFARFADRNTLAGASNPFAPPIAFAMEGDRAIGTVTFGAPFEGIPGHVHGGLVAASFDQLFGFLQSKRGMGSLTVELTVRYRKPTPLFVPLTLEARVLSDEGRRTALAARLLHDGQVTAEADGVFVTIDPEKLRSVFSRRPSEG